MATIPEVTFSFDLVAYLLDPPTKQHYRLSLIKAIDALINICYLTQAGL